MPTKKELIRLVLEEYERRINYVRKYCLDTIRLANRDQFGIEYDDFTKERVNVELKYIVEDIIALLDGKGVCK